MKTFAGWIITVIALLSFAPAHAEPDAKATYKDIERTLGFVPSFFDGFPEAGIAAAWDELKAVQLNPRSALPMKTKELIGLAVAAQIPCRYCTYFHTEAATKLGGATRTELKEAIAMAAITRHWSTSHNGLQIDLGEFKQDMARILAHFKAGKSKASGMPITDAASAYKDIETTLGHVPTFFRRFPEAGIASAWRVLKSVQLNPATKLSGKQKELIGLAVAAQIPCAYCIAFHTEAAKLNGATDAEIREAVAMASIVRHWSTVLNGSQLDEARFRREVDRIVVNAKRAKR